MYAVECLCLWIYLVYKLLLVIHIYTAVFILLYLFCDFFTVVLYTVIITGQLSSNVQVLCDNRMSLVTCDMYMTRNVPSMLLSDFSLVSSSYIHIYIMQPIKKYLFLLLWSPSITDDNGFLFNVESGSYCG